MVVVCEGKASVELSDSVFYNKVQEFNRDLSISVISLFQKENKKKKSIRILEALSASGLRAIRYAKEVDGIETIYANDLDSKAVDLIKKNVSLNKEEKKIIITQEDANMLMNSKQNFFDVIDLDPYGSAAPFIDAAVRTVAEEGLLCITCTDLAILCGKNPETSFSRYGGTSNRTPFCHETAFRLLLSAISNSAGKYKRVIIPLLSLSIDFYVRVFVRVFSSPELVKEISTKHGLVYHCGACFFFSFHPLCVKEENVFRNKINTIPKECPICNSSIRIFGPMWIGNTNDSCFIRKLLEKKIETKTKERIYGMLSVVSEELSLPFYFTLPKLSSVLRCTTPSKKEFCSALLNSGYSVSSTHANPDGIKTDAPFSFIWCVLKETFDCESLKRTTSISKKILKLETTETISFEKRKEAISESQRKKLVRYQQNPERNWGPKKKAY